MRWEERKNVKQATQSGRGGQSPLLKVVPSTSPTLLVSTFPASSHGPALFPSTRDIRFANCVHHIDSDRSSSGLCRRRAPRRLGLSFDRKKLPPESHPWSPNSDLGDI